MADLTATDGLGRDNAGKYVGLRQGEYWERTENSNYYCGGCGWKVTDHDRFCPECGGAFRECDASNLEDENAKLRDENELLQAHVRSLQHARMLDENERERLNEFVVSLADQFNINSEWADMRWCLSGCMNLFKCHPTDGEVKIRCPAWARLRELGVVVDR